MMDPKHQGGHGHSSDDAPNLKKYNHILLVIDSYHYAMPFPPNVGKVNEVYVYTLHVNWTLYFSAI